MPRETAWMLRAALIHLVLGFALGALLLVAKERPIGLSTAASLGVHRDVVLIGWMAQVVLGVAYWILPKYPREPIRGRRWPILAAAMLLNAGIAADAVGYFTGAAAVGHLTFGVAGVLFVAALFPRVKAFGAGRAGATR